MNFNIIQKINNEFTIQFQPTFNCNFNCFYCTQKKRVKEKINEDKILETAKKIANKIPESEKKIKLILIGGEVTLLNIKKILIPFINKHFNSFKLSFDTNFSASLEYFFDLLKFCNNNNIKLRINASYHYSDLNEFYNKLKELNKEKIIVYTKIILTTKESINNVNPFEAFYKLRKVSPVRMIIGRMLNNSFYPLTNKQKELFSKLPLEKEKNNYLVILNNGQKEYYYHLKNLNDNNFYGCLCKTEIVIDYNENVSYGMCSQKRNRTKLDNISFYSSEEICKQKRCPLCGIITLKQNY